MSLGSMSGIFDYAINIRNQNICQELLEILLGVLPSLAGYYNFHIIEIPINNNREFCVFEHTHHDGNNSKCTTLFNESNFSDIKNQVEKAICGGDDYRDLSAFLSEIQMLDLCKDGINAFAKFLISDKALELVTESKKLRIGWQNMRFHELDRFDDFVKYLYKPKTDSIRYFSKLFPYRGSILAFCISVNMSYWEEHKILFDNSFINFQGHNLDEYGSFLLTVINNYFSKWTDIYYYGLSETGTHLMTDYSVVTLSANDITEGRNIPSIELYRDISSSRYESAPCVGKLALFLLPENNEDEYEIIYFSKAIPLRKENTRLLRKLIELTKEKYFLVASCLNENQTEVVGLSSREKCWQYEIIFNGYSDFQILFCGNELIHVTGKRFYYTENQYVKQIAEAQQIIEKEILSSMIDAASSQLHGTTLIIFKQSQRAREETSRLSCNNRGIELQKPECAKDLIPLLSSIDGAIIADASGLIHGFGIILDGKAYKGDTSRGARYNSAISYINDSELNSKNDCIAFVFSEDKTVDIITPN